MRKRSWNSLVGKRANVVASADPSKDGGIFLVVGIGFDVETEEKWELLLGKDGSVENTLFFKDFDECFLQSFPIDSSVEVEN